MNFFRQLWAILRMNLAGIPARLGSSLTILVGVTSAVGVLVSMLALGIGAREQQLATVRPDRAVLTTTGSKLGQGSLTRDEAAVILGLPGIKKDAHGDPLVAFQTFVPLQAYRRVTNVRIYFPLIGITPNVTEVAPEIHLSAGRMFQPGLRELIVSLPCSRQYVGFEMGDRRVLHATDWTIVGQFDRGASQQCVVYGDVKTVMTLTKSNVYSMATVLLNSPADYAVLRDAVGSNPVLKVDVQHEKDLIEDSFKPLNAVLDFVSFFVGTIMALGATLGAVNSLYAIVDSRRREMATLRAIGFSSSAVVTSVLIESIVLALPGAVLGTLAA